MNAETLEHVGLGVSLALGVILLIRYLLTGSIRLAKAYETVEGDGIEPGIREWRNEVRALLHLNVAEHAVLTENQRVIGQRLDDIQSELAHNGGTSVKDAVHRTEAALNNHLLAADMRQEATARHMLEIRQALENQGLQLPDQKEPPHV